MFFFINFILSLKIDGLVCLAFNFLGCLLRNVEFPEVYGINKSLMDLNNVTGN